MSVIKGNHAGSAGSDFYSYKINQSLKFDQNKSSALTRTPASAGNQRLWTFSAWAKKSTLDLDGYLLGVGTSSAPELIKISNSSTDQFEYAYWNGSVFVYQVRATALLRDSSAWYHVVLAVDTAQGTAANRVKFYVNGTQLTDFSISTYPTQNADTRTNAAVDHRIGSGIGSAYYDGYIAEVNFIDGAALTPASFGETKDGIWVAKDSSGLTFGNNGFYLPFDDSSAIGDDESSNTNDFTANNLAATDVVPDSPTNNFSTMSPLLTDTNNTTFSEGNLKTVNSAASTSGSSIAVSSGKWFVEMVCTAKTATNAMIGICTVDGFDGERQLDESQNGGSGHGYVMNASKLPGGASYGATWAVDDIIGIALDLDSGQNTVTFYKNGSSQGAINIDNALYVFCNSNGQGSSTVTYVTNFGQDGTFAGEITAGGNADGNGVGNFKYSVPSGYLALCTKNLPDITIGPEQSTLATDNFNALIYTGDDGSSRAVTGVGFSPDWVWIKNRDVSEVHALYDTVRGATKYLSTESTDDEQDRGVYGLRSFDSDGFTLGPGGEVNDTNEKYVAWNWKAGGSASSNSNGSITSSVSANTAAGFSIVGFEGTGSNATIGHGLSAAPEMIIVKNRENSSGLWLVYHKDIIGGATQYMQLESTVQAYPDNSSWNDTAPTSTVFSVGTSVASNQSGKDMIAYCFHSVEGYSKLGGYTGNGGSDGTFIFTGFRPAWIMVKRESGGAGSANWVILDTERDIHNLSGIALMPNLIRNEYTPASSGYPMDILSNGFKQRGASVSQNESGSTYIYMAFAESPFKFANAR